MDRRILRKEQIRSVQRQIPIHLICRYLMVSFYPIFAAGIHQYGSTYNIGIQKNLWIFDRTVYMTLSRKIYYNIRLLFLEETVYRIPVRNTFFYKAKIGIIHDRFQG